MKVFEEPIIEIQKFNAEDVITASVPDDPNAGKEDEF